MKKLFFLVLIVALLVGTTTVLAGPPEGVPRGRPKGASSDGPPDWAPRGPPEGVPLGPPSGPRGKSNNASLTLVSKDASWNVVWPGPFGTLKYNLEGPEFCFVFNGHGLEAGTDYSLIYYADFEDRYVDWGGNNPGALIKSGTSNDGGNIHLGGCVDLGMDLPHADDANGDISNWDYSGPPDYYAHATGAKIWLVPSDCYVAGQKKVDTWTPDRFLFETDLITYTDTDAE